MSDSLDLGWQLTRDDHLAYLWWSWRRRLPISLAVAAVLPATCALALGLGLGLRVGLLAAPPLFGVLVSLVLARSWSLSKRRAMADLDRRPAALGPASAHVDAVGIHLESAAAGGTIAWSAVTQIVVKNGFFVVRAGALALLTVPLRFVPDPERVVERFRAWKADPAPLPGSEPPADATHEVHYRLSPADHAAVARAQLWRHYRTHLPRRVWNAVVLGGVFIACLAAGVVEEPPIRYGLWVLAAGLALLGTLPLWLVAITDQRVRRMARGRPSATEEQRLYADPERIWIGSGTVLAERRWSGVQSVERDKRFLYLRLTASRVVAVPLGALPGDSEAFFADLLRWKREAPVLAVSLPHAPRATGTPSDNPFEAPAS